MAKDLIERWIEESKGLKPVRSRKMTPEEQKRWKEKKKIRSREGKGQEVAKGISCIHNGKGISASKNRELLK